MTPGKTNDTTMRIAAGLPRRLRRDRLFRALGALSTGAGVAFLVVFLATIMAQGASAFTQASLRLQLDLDADLLAPNGSYDPALADFDAVIRNAVLELIPDARSRDEQRALMRLVSIGAAFELRDYVDRYPQSIGTDVVLTVPASSLADQALKSEIDRSLPEGQRPVSNRQLGWIDSLVDAGVLALGFNRNLFVNGDSREPELAGIRGALTGSLLMLAITIVVALPLGVAAAVYLEEFATRNRWTELVEVNINNLAAVPSIIFGLLGLAVFIDWFGMPRSAPLVGGLVLSLLTLPIIIIASRAAIHAVPGSIREAALALGASRMQLVFDHVLPLAMPGILTGAIMGLSRAFGETAPLLMIGMVAFIVDVPGGITDPSTALPVQIYLWADSPERAFAHLTAAAIVILLAVLLLLNLGAIIMRKRLQDRVKL